MTREEAIRLIGWLKCTTNREDDLEAIDMAIEALSTDAVMRDATAEERASVQRYIDSISTEAVSVVRCKDCKWYMLTDHNETEVCTNKQWDISMAVYPIISADDFCSYGERREE